jgi:uncharacterized membrane protein YkoI
MAAPAAQATATLIAQPSATPVAQATAMPAAQATATPVDQASGVAPAIVTVTADQARSIAEAANPGATALEVDFDHEDGFALYKVELNNGRDVTIDASTGAVLGMEGDGSGQGGVAPATVSITADQARSIAETANPGTTALEVEFDHEDGLGLFKVELNNGRDVTIDANTGAILGMERDGANQAAPATVSITADQARSIAETANPGTTALEIDFDHDDGFALFKVELNNGRDVTIDANTGAILGMEGDGANQAAPATVSITADQARSIAETANPGATALEVEFDHDDGFALFKVELNNGRDVTIDASTGMILGMEGDGSGQGGVAPATASITADQARSIAETAHPGATALEIEFDHDDGFALFKVELNNGIDVTIDASTGAILGSER